MILSHPIAWIFAMAFAQTAVGEDQRAEFVDLLAQANSEFDAAQHIQSEQPDRARQLFLSAARRFESAARSGIANGKLEYNTGNAYLQAGDVGRAILHYRRAQRLIPNDPLLADNLSLAKSKCLTVLQPTARGDLLRTLLFWHDDTTLAQRAITAMALYVVFWLLLCLRSFRAHRGLTVAAVACIMVSMTAAASAGASWWSDKRTPAGVILAMDVSVYKGPGTTYQRQFLQPLQPGVGFTLQEQRGQWWEIELADGKTGWIEANKAELVPTDRSGSLQLIEDS